MYYGFNTMNKEYAKAALVLYAMYKSRNQSSPLNGLETWNRVESFCKGACKKSVTTSGFVTKFKEMADVGAIKPRYLRTSESGLQIMADGSVIESSEIMEYKTALIEDDEIRKTIENNYPLITMLVRERIQREKLEYSEEIKEDEED